MKSLLSVFFVAMLSAFPVCAARAQRPDGVVGLTALEVLFLAQPKPEALGSAITLEDAEQIALLENPEITVAARRVAVAEAHVPVAGALDDPMAMYQGLGVPLSQPWNFNDAQNMFSFSKSFYGAGKRALRTSVAQSDVDVAKEQLDEVRLQVRVRVRKAFDDLLLADQETKIHDEHVGIARQAIEAARIKYAVGRVSQQDILKAQVALTELAEHMIRFDHDAGIARARLNTLLGRDPTAPLNVRGQFAVASLLPTVKTLEELALQSRPDLAAARDASERSHKQQALAKKAYVPDFTITGGYMLMPASADMRNTYLIQGTMNLPWLNRRKHNAEIAEATAAATEQDTELAEMRNVAFEQIGEALVEAQTAQKFVRLYQDLLRPQAEATLQSSVIAYENDKTDFLDLLDSQMTVILVDLAWVQAMTDFDSRLADLELAAGSTLDQFQQPVPEVKP
ncbi:MAG: TolC family protein [Candidatus Korobacteraceae bacterium]